MSGIKKVLVTLLFIYVCVLFSGFFLPKQSVVSRSIEIDASQARVFELVSDHRQAQQWSPWFARDPKMQIEYSGPEQGVSSKQTWRSEHPKVGNRESTIISYDAPNSVEMRIEFNQGGGFAGFQLNGSENGKTLLTWWFKSEHKNVFERFIGALLLESMIASDYEYGLAKIKEVAEKQGPSGPVGKVVSYRDGDSELTGFLAKPINRNKAPVVIVVHEWWGHNDYARERASMLAELGYVAFAIDMYGGGRLASHPADAKAFMNEVVSNASVLHSRFDSALSFIAQDQDLADQPVAVIGYCFGGSVALSMARANKDIVGAVSFHGGVSGLAPIEGGADVPVLVLNGAADPFVKQEDLNTFQVEMDAANIDAKIINYSDAKHSFTSKEANKYGQEFDLPLEYNEAADQASWQEMQRFLNRIFKHASD